MLRLTDLWTCARVAKVIRKTFDVEYHPSHVWKLLRSFGFTCQKPEQDAREQDPDEVRRWIEEEWPRIKETAREERCMIGFLDEFGLMLQPVRRRTWAPKGKTPNCFPRKKTSRRLKG